MGVKSRGLRILLRAMYEAGLGLAVTLTMLACLALSPLGYRLTTDASAADGFYFLATFAGAFVAMIALHMRRVAPMTVLVVQSLLALLIPIGPVAALVTLTSQIRRGTARQSVMASVGVLSLLAIMAWRDVDAANRGSSTLQLFASSPGTAREVFVDVPTWVSVGATVGPVVVAIILGMVLRHFDTLSPLGAKRPAWQVPTGYRERLTDGGIYKGIPEPAHYQSADACASMHSSRNPLHPVPSRD